MFILVEGRRKLVNTDALKCIEIITDPTGQNGVRVTYLTDENEYMASGLSSSEVAAAFGAVVAQLNERDSVLEGVAGAAT